MKILVIVLVSLLSSISTNAQSICVVDKYDDLLQKLSSPDTTYIVNYWATWCGPCVKELPYFFALAESLSNTKNKVVLVSLDFKSQLEKKVIPFFEKNPTTASVFLLADKDYDSYIERVHPTWDGPIPITVVLKGDKKLFTDQEFENLAQLRQFVKPLLTF